MGETLDEDLLKSQGRSRPLARMRGRTQGLLGPGAKSGDNSGSGL